MGSKKKTNLFGWIFAALMLVGLVLVVVGMCIGNINMALAGRTETITLFDESWETLKEANNALETNLPQPTFGIIAFVVTLVGAAILVLDAVLRIALKKDIKLIRMIGAAVTLIGAILILVAGLVLASDFNSYYDELNKIAGDIGNFLGKDLEVKPYSAGAGVWLGFIGGLVAAVAGGLSTLKVFNK